METSSNKTSDSDSENGEATRQAQQPNSRYKVTIDEVIEQHIGELGVSQILHALLVSIAWVFDARPLLYPFSPTLSLLRGSGVYGYLADSWFGRKKTLLLSCLLTFVTTFAISFSPNVWVYSLLRLTNGFLRSGIGSCCIVLATEIVGKKWRGQVGQYGFFFFTLGFLSLPFMAYLERKSWRNLYRITSFPPLRYAIFLLPFAYESPRWLLVKGRNKEAMVVLKKLSKLNGKKLPADISLLDPIQEKDIVDQTSSSAEKFWKTKWAVKRMLMVMISGFGSGFVYYGFQLNAENLNFNLYLTVIVNALMEFPAVFIGSFLLAIMKRRPLFSNSSYIAGVASLLCVVLSFRTNAEHKIVNVGKWLQLSVEAVGFMASSTAFDILFVYCVELFPTNVRNTAVSLLRQAFMLGASVAPVLVAVGRESAMMSFIAFGVASILSGFASLWLRETQNSPLYETLEQQGKAEEMKNKTVLIA